MSEQVTSDLSTRDIAVVVLTKVEAMEKRIETVEKLQREQAQIQAKNTFVVSGISKLSWLLTGGLVTVLFGYLFSIGQKVKGVIG